MAELHTTFDNKPEHLRAIGKITVYFAMLENTMEFFAWTIISTDQRLGQIITAELSFRNLIGLLSSIYKHRSEENGIAESRIVEFEKLLNRAVTIEERRNSIIHSVWGPGKELETIMRSKTTAKKTKGLKHQFEQTSLEDLEKIANSIAELINDFHNNLAPSVVVS